MKEKNKMKLRITLLSLLMTLYVATTAWAQNPHFVGKPTASFSGTNANVCFKEAGLGDNQLINYTAAANATATYVCVNNGGQCPNAANKTTVSGPVSASGAFNSGKNGSVSACLQISPPSAAPFTCPSGQTLTLASVSYTDISIKDDTNGIGPVTTTPSTLAAIFFTCP